MNILRIISPVILVSLLAILTINIAKKGSKKEKTKEENYMSEGMVIGMCLGTGIVIALDKNNFVIGTSIGMLLGMIIGMKYKK